jgi:hypothetical protein
MTSTFKQTPGNLSYRDEVMNLRKKFDLFPWIEVQRRKWDGAPYPSTTIQQHSFQLKVPRDLYISEIASINVNWSVLSSLECDFVSVPSFEAQLTEGVEQESLVSAPVLSDQLLGSVFEELKRFPTGMRAPADSVRNIIARTAPAPVGYGIAADRWSHDLWLGHRGYQLRKKGSHQTPQLTYAEYDSQGYRADPFAPVLFASIDPAASETLVEFTLPELHAVDYITVRFNHGDLRSSGVVQLKLEAPNNPALMDDFCPAPLLGTSLNRTAWFFPQPISAPKGGIWRLKVRTVRPGMTFSPVFLEQVPVPRISVVLHGHNMVRR